MEKNLLAIGNIDVCSISQLLTLLFSGI
jgi:hypothetical protein